MNRRTAAKLVTAALAAPAWGRTLSALPAVPPIRFSFMLWALERSAPFDQCLQIVSEAGYQGVELVGEFHDWSPDERFRMLASMHSLNLVVDSMSGVKAGFAVPEDTALFKSQFISHLQAATDLNCPQVILLSGKRVESLPAQTQRDISVENLKWAAEKAADRHIEIVIEPIDLLENPTIYLASVTTAFEIVRAVNQPNVKVLYDLYHEQRSFGNLLEKLESNIDRIGLIHVADVPGRHEPGTGEIDYAAIFRKLGELHYSRWIAMEYYPTGDPLASLRKSRIDALAAFNSR
jgi:hydroxypyruvate isomerase